MSSLVKWEEIDASLGPRVHSIALLGQQAESSGLMCPRSWRPGSQIECFHWEEAAGRSADGRGAEGVLGAHGRVFDAIVVFDAERFLSRSARLPALLPHLSSRGRLVLCGRFAAGPASSRKSSAAGEGEGESARLPSLATVLTRLAENGLYPLPAGSFRRSPLPRSGPGLSTAAGRPILLVCGRSEYRVAVFEQQQLEALLALFERSFHHKRSEDHWRWKFQRSPFGREHISVGLDPRNRVIGQYCAYPVPLISYLEGSPRRFLAHQVGDTMTAITARTVGRGSTSILARLAGHFYSRFCVGRIAFNYGFLTDTHREMSKRFLGALDAGPVRVWSRRSGTRAPLLDAASPSGYRVRPLDVTDSGIDRLMVAAGPAYGLLVERSSRYLQWRFVERPDVDYLLLGVWRGKTLVGWSCFRLDGEVLLWGDALVHPEHKGAVALLLSEAECRFPGAKEISGWFSAVPMDWLAELTSLGFHERPHPADLSLLQVPFDEPSVAARLVRDFYYTQADSDLF